jgi:nucleoid-associated protein YgaU
MPNDAKLGLVLGVGLVVAIAVVFFRKEPATADAAPRPAAAVRTATDPDPQPAARRHTVRSGDTLYSIARQYYRDEARFVDIYRANREALRTPAPLAPGTVLLIPEARSAD